MTSNDVLLIIGLVVAGCLITVDLGMAVGRHLGRLSRTYPEYRPDQPEGDQ